MKLSKEEFIQEYCEQSKIEWSELSTFRKVFICDCENIKCRGWVMVPLDAVESKETK